MIYYSRASFLEIMKYCPLNTVSDLIYLKYFRDLKWFIAYLYSQVIDNRAWARVNQLVTSSSIEDATEKQPKGGGINDPSSEATTSLEWSLSSPPAFHVYSTLRVQN
jgi:hypothetical protein